VYSSLAIGLYSCASTGNPSGGPKDVRPAKLDSLTSTPDKQLRFKPKQLVFNFDEFVEVKDPLKQVLVSPPLTYIPKVTTRGKRVTFTFDDKEVLRENATYTINFGEAIVDFTEGNKVNNFAYVFSTGDYLDSLNITGRILNALTNEPEPEMVVFLYDNLEDSIVRKEKPFYFAKPDKEGNFRFQNIKSDTFRIFAIKDENLNFKYDLESEKIAFVDSLITLTDSLSPILLRASLPIPSFTIRTVNSKNYGKVNILCNTSPDLNIPYTVSYQNIIHHKETVGDSINIYYQTDQDSFYIYIADDTLKVKPKGYDEFMKKTKFKNTLINPSALLLPSDSLVFNFNYPIGDVAFESIEVYDTIGVLEGIQYSFLNNHKGLTIKYPWVAGEKYVIEMDSGIVKSIYGHVLDSIGHAITILTKDKTTNLNIKISTLDSTQNYVVRILKDKTFITQVSISEVTEYELMLKGLVPEKYNVEIIEDANKNGIWDPGNYDNKQQPEKFVLSKGEKLRENRDAEMLIDFKAGLQPKIEPKAGPQGLQNTNNQSQKRK
jgi:hypothetical protein